MVLTVPRFIEGFYFVTEYLCILNTFILYWDNTIGNMSH